MKRAMAATGAATASSEPNHPLDNRQNRKRFFPSPGKRKRRSNVLLFSLFLLGFLLYVTSIHSIYSAQQLEGMDAKTADVNMGKSKNSNSKNNQSGKKPDGVAEFLKNRGEGIKIRAQQPATKDSLIGKKRNNKNNGATAGFVHLGKTAGSTLSLLLRNGCHSFVKKPCRTVANETATSRLVEAYYHIPDFHRLPTSNHRIYILSVRDVFDRTVSSFLYHHPKNIPFFNDVTVTEGMQVLGPIAYKCFPTLEAFASLMHRGNATDCNYPYRHFQIINKDCSELACAAIHGRVRHFIHLFFNYRNIYAKIPTSQPPKRLFVIRKERLWEDWWKVDAMLRKEEGQQQPPLLSSGEVLVGSARNTTGMKLPVSRDISDSRREQLCKALEPEYRMYFRILNRAENIGTRELEDAAMFAQTNCPNLEFRSILASQQLSE